MKVEVASKLPKSDGFTEFREKLPVPKAKKQIPPLKTFETSIIKPCPFCGNKDPELVSESEGMHYELGTCYLVRCNFLKGGCGARGGGREEKSDAIDAWNKRS